MTPAEPALEPVQALQADVYTDLMHRAPHAPVALIESVAEVAALATERECAMRIGGGTVAGHMVLLRLTDDLERALRMIGPRADGSWAQQLATKCRAQVDLVLWLLEPAGSA